MITAIHIEDEPRNIELFANLIQSHCGDMVTLKGSAQDYKHAIALIKATKPQLVYLDIELKQGNAFDMLMELNEQHLFTFEVIFVTAFDEYAVKAFRHNAVDYLLKPISIEELKEATTKAVNRINHMAGNENVIEAIRQLNTNFTTKKIGLPVKDGVQFINLNELIRAEAKGSYSVLYLTNGQKITSTRNLKDIELMLPDWCFARVHNSWIINIKYLRKYYRGKNGYMEMEDGSTVMVSIRKKGKFLDLF